MLKKACFRIVMAAGLAAALLPASLFAGSRIAPVAAMCPPDRPQRVIDADGEHDRCLAREAPKCSEGAVLRADVKADADACVAAGAPPGKDAVKTQAPKCRSGFRLAVGAARDACEKTGPPLCPSGAILKTMQGEDQCRY